MHQRVMTVSVIAIHMILTAASSAQADVIAEDKGIYKKDSWNISKRYDDLDNPHDAPGIITKGHDPAKPSGPAVDFEELPDPDKPGGPDD